MVEESKFLKDDANSAAQRGQRLARGLHGVFSKQEKSPACRSMGKINHLEERGLAGTRRTGKESEFALIKRHSHVREGFGRILVGQAYPLKSDNLFIGIDHAGFDAFSGFDASNGVARVPLVSKHINDSGLS